MRYSVCLNDFLIYLLTVVHSFGSAEMTTLESFLNLCASISTMKFTHINSWACVSFRFVHWAHEQLHVSGRIRHFSYDSNLNAWYFLWLDNGHGHDLLIVAKTFIEIESRIASLAFRSQLHPIGWFGFGHLQFRPSSNPIRCIIKHFDRKFDKKNCCLWMWWHSNWDSFTIRFKLIVFRILMFESEKSHYIRDWGNLSENCCLFDSKNGNEFIFMKSLKLSQ